MNVFIFWIGLKKEEIKVEVEDSRYLIIRTEAANETTEPTRSFLRKFRLPGMVDMNGICASYRDGVLTITVPRTLVRRGFFIEPADLPERMVNLGARAGLIYFFQTRLVNISNT